MKRKTDNDQTERDENLSKTKVRKSETKENQQVKHEENEFAVESRKGKSVEVARKKIVQSTLSEFRVDRLRCCEPTQDG